VVVVEVDEVVVVVDEVVVVGSGVVVVVELDVDEAVLVVVAGVP